MQTEELEAYVRGQGYSHVSVQANGKGFVVYYWSRQYKSRLNMHIPISEVSLSQTARFGKTWLAERFPKVKAECDGCGQVLADEPKLFLKGERVCQWCYDKKQKNVR